MRNCLNQPISLEWRMSALGPIAGVLSTSAVTVAIWSEADALA